MPTFIKKALRMERLLVKGLKQLQEVILRQGRGARSGRVGGLVRLPTLGCFWYPLAVGESTSCTAESRHFSTGSCCFGECVSDHRPPWGIEFDCREGGTTEEKRAGMWRVVVHMGRRMGWWLKHGRQMLTRTSGGLGASLVSLTMGARRP